MNKIEEMINRFQCPGCVCGSDTKCGKYKYDNEHRMCINHVIGTHLGLGNKIALRFWEKDQDPGWDDLNVPVWVMEQDGYLFVWTYLPRLNHGYVDVIEGGTLDMVSSSFDVSKLIDEID